jgi:glycosyltransferase
MTDLAVLSIITPSLSSAAVLADCIESVRGQRSKCEHILVDGASTDGTMEVAEGYAGHFAYVISESDSGLYAAMNKGIGLATGDIIGILNADDFYASGDTLAVVAAALSDPAVDACYGDLEYVAAEDSSRVVRRWRAGAFGGDRFLNGWMPPHPTLFLRREVYERCGLFREDLGTSADYEFMLRVFVKHGLTAAYIPRVLVRMRTGGASNRSLAARWRANRNDARAWQVNGLRPRPWTLLAKPLRKMGQWWV